MAYRAVIFDLGGVVFPSPFDVFDAYERDAGLPPRFIRTVVAASAEDGAWARFERSELSFADFCAALEAECADAGGTIDAAALMQGIGAGLRAAPGDDPRHRSPPRRGPARRRADQQLGPARRRHAARARRTSGFDTVVESAVEGIRKPDPRDLRARVRAPRGDPGRLRVPRRPRREPQAGARDGHDHDQGRSTPPTRWSSSASTSASTWSRPDGAARHPPRGAGPGDRGGVGRRPGRSRAHRARSRPGRAARRLARRRGRRPRRELAAAARDRDRRAAGRTRSGSRSRSTTSCASTTPTPTRTSRSRSCASARTTAGRRWSKGGGRTSAARHPTCSGPASSHALDAVIEAHNVVGIMPGSDPAKAGEAIVIGAHYDHVGLGGRLSVGARAHRRNSQRRR